MSPIVIIAIGAGVTVLGAIVTAFGTYLQHRSASEKSSRILTLTESTSGEIRTLQDHNKELDNKVEKQLETIDKLRRENTQLNLQLQKDSKEIYNNLTGAESYCEVTLGQMTSANPDQLTVMVLNNSDYPLREVTVRKYDINSHELMSLKSANEDTYVIGFVRAKSAAITPWVFQLDRKSGFSFNFFFYSNGPESIHMVRRQFANNKWQKAEKLIVRDKVISVIIDPDFPVQNPAEIFK
jgi:hypothetical protein